MVGVTVLRPWLSKTSCWLWISVSSVLTCFLLRKPSKTKPLSLDLNVSLLVFMAGMLVPITLWSAAFNASLIVTCQTSSCVAQKTKSGGGSPPQCLERAAPRRSNFRCWEIPSPNLILTWHMTNFCTKICSWLLLQLWFSSSLIYRNNAHSISFFWCGGQKYNSTHMFVFSGLQISQIQKLIHRVTGFKARRNHENIWYDFLYFKAIQLQSISPVALLHLPEKHPAPDIPIYGNMNTSEAGDSSNYLISKLTLI